MAMSKERTFKWLKEKWYLLFLALVLFVRVFFWFSPSHAEKINIIYLWPAAIAAAVLLIAQNKKRLTKSFWLTAGIFTWLVISCTVNGDPYLIYNRTFIIYMFIVLINFFLAVPMLRPDLRRKGFHVLAAVYCVLMVMLALLGIYAALSGDPIKTAFSDNSIRVADNRLYYFEYHPNEVASAFTVGLLLMLYMILESRRVLPKIALAVGILICGFALSLTGSRTSILIAAGGMGIFVFWLVFSGLTQNATWLRWLTGLAALGLVALLVYNLMMASIDVAAIITMKVKTISIAAETVANETRPELLAGEQKPQKNSWLSGEAQQTANAQPAVSTLPSESPEQEKIDSDDSNIVFMDSSRKNLDDLLTFNLRVELWQAGLAYIQEHPMVLIFGATDNVVARIPALVGRDEFHLHNVYLEMLLLGGIPGLAMYLFVLFLVFRAGWLLAFRYKVSLAYRFLGTVPLLLAINGITEIYPLFSGNVMDMMSMAISGAVLVFADVCDIKV